MNRNSGILMHISSLYGDFGCGNFGKSAFGFIDFLKESGFTYWQVLPICITDDHNSPYMSFSSFGCNPNFIDPQILYDNGLVTLEELNSQKQSSPYLCEYENLNSSRYDFLKKASSRYINKKDIEDFLEENSQIAKCCEFMALKIANNNKCWTEWTVKTPNKDDLFAWQFIQFEANRQWAKVREYANEKGIKIIGDLPFYVAFDSCDVWDSPDCFMLDENHKPTSVAGVPPDYFAKDGQLWGNPLYDWKRMKSDNYSWWKNRVSHMLKLFDGIRIDHFRALSDYWSVPATAKTAKEGKWIKGPRKDMIKAIKEVSGDNLIIAENLGDIDEEVEKLLEYSKFPGMSVFQFGFDGNNQNPHLPHNFCENLVAYTGTHDNNTLLGFIWELDDKTRSDVLKYIGFTDYDWDKCYETIFRIMLMSKANTVIFPIQDILGYGADTRLNTPGRADGNWQYRTTKEQLDSIDKTKLYSMNKMYGRI